MEPTQRREEPKWFVRAQGATTLGPFGEREILAGLRAGDFLASDSVHGSREPGWTPLLEHPRFAAHFSARPTAAELRRLPSPRILRRREPVPVIAAAPASAPAPTPEPQPLPAAAAVSATEAEARPAPEALPEALPELPEVEAAFPSESEPEPEPEEADDLAALSHALERAVEQEEIRAAAAPVAEEPLAPAVANVPLASAAGPAPPEAIPARPELQVFLADPSPRVPREKSRREKRVIQIELKLPERPLRAALVFLLLALVAGGAGFWMSAKKTRDQKGFRLSDPSSPTTLPQETGDPIPPLKAPTRPRRE
jgi:hypothetical protein